METRKFVDSLFEGYEESAALAEFKEEIRANLGAKIESLVAQGMSEDEAWEKARDQLGDVLDLAEDFALVKQTGTFFTNKFSAISIECACKVNVHLGRARHRAVITPGSEELVMTEIRGDALRIYSRQDKRFYFVYVGSSKKTVVDVYMPELRGLEVKGMGNVSVSDGISAPLEISVSGSGKINLGAGRVPLLTVKISGMGDIDARKIEAENVEVAISGMGKIKAHATKAIKGKISGSGKVYLRGEPSNHIRISGSGKVVWQDEEDCDK
ncbi:MAG: DUF2807 domain-containing protein [Treponema sp.]|nr:DUF2807 domain-containing protein [Treponema sp.]